MEKVRVCIKNCIPPLITIIVRYVQNKLVKLWMGNKKQEWEFIAFAWPKTNGVEKGWLESSIAITQRKKWHDFKNAIKAPNFLGVAHEATELRNNNFSTHNLVMAFGYCLGLATQSKDKISVLDWGGGLGHYYLFAKALYPDMDMEYTCKETELLCAEGISLLPEVNFESSLDQVFSKTYDLVFASCSIHYEENWKLLLGKLIQASNKYIYITRLPVVENVPSFVIKQRPYNYGYNTEYISWTFNREEILEEILNHKVRLLREFLVDPHPEIHGAPEKAKFTGFLFEKI